MKRMLLKFADQVLSREELKAVRGASGRCGTCSAGGGLLSVCLVSREQLCRCVIGPFMCNQ